MTPDIALITLSLAEEGVLIRSLLPLVGQLASASVRIAEPKARMAKLERPARTALLFGRRYHKRRIWFYNRNELPSVRPDVTWVRLFGGSYTCREKRAIAPAPAGLEPGSPFRCSVAALVVYLH